MESRMLPTMVPAAFVVLITPTVHKSAVEMKLLVFMCPS
jgi:hypothetical protein